MKPLIRLSPLPQAKVKPNKDKNRTYTVTYVPKVEGLHKVRQSSRGSLHLRN